MGGLGVDGGIFHWGKSWFERGSFSWRMWRGANSMLYQDSFIVVGGDGGGK